MAQSISWRCEYVEDAMYSGRSARNEGKVSKIIEIVQESRRLSTGMIAEMGNTKEESVRQIWHDELYKTFFLNNRTIGRILAVSSRNNTQKNQIHRQISSHVRKHGFLNKSIYWKTAASPRIKKPRMSISKQTLITFFKDIFMTAWVPEGKIVNWKYYEEESIRKNWPNWGKYSALVQRAISWCPVC